MIEREKLVFIYTSALERGDMQIIADILTRAADDPVLGEMIAEINSLSDEEKPIMQLTRSMPTVPMRSITLMLAAAVALIFCALILIMRPAQSWLPLAVDTPSPDPLTELYHVDINQLSDFALSPDGSMLAIATSNGVFIHNTNDLENGRHIGEKMRVSQIAFMPDSERVVTSRTGYIEVVNIATGETLQYPLMELSFYIYGYLYAIDDDTIITTGCIVEERICDTRILVEVKLSTGEITTLAEGIKDGNFIAVSPDRTLLAYEAENTNVHIINLQTHEIISTFTVIGTSPFDITNEHLVAANNSYIRAYDLYTGEQAFEKRFSLSSQIQVVELSEQSELYIATNTQIFKAAVEFDPLEIADPEEIYMSENTSSSSLRIPSTKLEIVQDIAVYYALFSDLTVIQPESVHSLTQYPNGLREVIWLDDSIITVHTGQTNAWNENGLVDRINFPPYADNIVAGRTSDGELALAWQKYNNSVLNYLTWLPGQDAVVGFIENAPHIDLRSNIFDDFSFLVTYGDGSPFELIAVDEEIVIHTPLEGVVFDNPYYANLVEIQDEIVLLIEYDVNTKYIIANRAGDILHTIETQQDNYSFGGSSIVYNADRDAYLVIVPLDTDEGLTYLGWWISDDGTISEQAFEYPCDHYICNTEYIESTPDGNLLFIVNPVDFQVDVLNLDTMEITSLPIEGGYFVVSPDGTKLAIGRYNGITVYEVGSF